VATGRFWGLRTDHGQCGRGPDYSTRTSVNSHSPLGSL
jgi:hypothetical protein